MMEHLLSDEEMLEIRKKVPESERGDIQGLIKRYLQAQYEKCMGVSDEELKGDRWRYKV